jgi:nicotinate phosphoribosyltransferase
MDALDKENFMKSNKLFLPIILSLMDTDLYKFTMWQALLHSHPANTARYAFFCRNKPAYPLSSLLNDINEQLDWLCSLRFTNEELASLGTKSYIKSDFIEFLRIFQFQRQFITARAVGDGIEIVAEGPQIHVMGFEIYVLAIVSELYFQRFDHATLLAESRVRLAAKIEMLKAFERNPAAHRRHPFEFVDMSTRRRYCRDWQDEFVGKLQHEVPSLFKGTSNVHFAQKYNLPVFGTMAHEYLQTFQAVGVQLRQSQIAALEAWVQEYRGDLGIALTDVIGMDAFLADFDLYFSKLYSGMRHDSGNPFIWGEKALAHYAKFRLDAHSKRLSFSDGLDFPKSFELYDTFGDRIPTGFGIGTHLGNDTGVQPLNIVMKLILCNGQTTAKLSDSEGKTLCTDEPFLAYLRQVFNR